MISVATATRNRAPPRYTTSHCNQSWVSGWDDSGGGDDSGASGDESSAGDGSDWTGGD